MLEVLKIYYLGRTKERSQGGRSALGFHHGSWSVIFPETVLREWFQGITLTEQSDAPLTLYEFLGVARDADHDTIRSAYRRLARQWHPDVCRDKNANEMFIQIQEAYQVLSNTGMRARYDAGLALEESLPTRERHPCAQDDDFGYRAPLRCGYVLAECERQRKWLVVNKIIGWEDIVDSYGRTLVTSWVYGDNKYTERWVET
jgi:hypothetical protein